MKELKLNKTQKELISFLLGLSIEFDEFTDKKYEVEGKKLLQKLYSEGILGTEIEKI